MAEKDAAEKILMSYNDVFADIVNALLFDGEPVVAPEELDDQAPRAYFKADGKIREIERDVAKMRYAQKMAWKEVLIPCASFWTKLKTEALKRAC